MRRKRPPSRFMSDKERLAYFMSFEGNRAEDYRGAVADVRAFTGRADEDPSVIGGHDRYTRLVDSQGRLREDGGKIKLRSHT